MEAETFSTPSAEAADFLERFDRLSQAGAADVGGLFAETFLVLDSTGARTLSPGMLASALPARRRMFEAAGVVQIRRAAARELRLDDQHRLLRVEWLAQRKDKSPIALASSFLLRKEESGLRVVVYVNHTDPRGLPREP